MLNKYFSSIFSGADGWRMAAGGARSVRKGAGANGAREGLGREEAGGGREREEDKVWLDPKTIIVCMNLKN